MTCSCSPFIAVASGATAKVPTGGIIPLGALRSHESARMRLIGDGITVCGCGDVEITGTVTLAPSDNPSTAVEIAVGLRKNGQVVQGASGRIDSTKTVTIPIVGCVQCDPCAPTTLTLVNDGAAADVESVSLTARFVR